MDNYEKYIGHVFDNRYRIDALIGIGGMAVVYKAVDLLMRRIVAVKILRDDIAADDASVQRFINESKAVAMLSHPNIVNIYDVSVRDNVKYIVMEYIEGITLKNYMTRREVLSFKETVGYSMQILRALEHAHRKGIVHREIKPQNIMLLRDGVIKVMDFGIAKLPNAETVTMTDKAIGTVYYISPEQASGETIDARSDLYSLGVLMYEMTTGRLPFDADSPVSVALMQVNDTPTPPREINPKIPQGLEQIILRAMEKEPSLRYQSAEEMLDCLEKLRENPAIVFKPSAAEKLRRLFSQRLKLGRINRTMMPIIIGVFSAFFIAFCISGAYIFTHCFLSSSIKDYETIEVDNFVGVTMTDELKSWFEDSKYFKLSGIQYKYDETKPSGEVIGQYPSAGEAKKVLAGKQFCNVSLVVSGGVQKIKLDDYVTLDYRLAVSELHSKQIRCEITKRTSLAQEYGRVLSTDPRPGETVKPGDTVRITVSAGSRGADVKMPDFKGLNEAEALLLVAQNRLKVGSVKYEKSDKAAGTVIGQSIEKDTGVYYLTVVDFTVSSGPKKETKATETTPAVTSGQKETVQTTDETETSDATETEPIDPDTIDTVDTSIEPDTAPPETKEEPHHDPERGR